MTQPTLAQQTLDTLLQYGWIKRLPGDNRVGHCLVGAIRDVATQGKSGYAAITSEAEECNDLIHRLQAVVKAAYPDRAEPGWTLVAFNDHPLTTWPDVERVLEKVIAAEQKFA